MVVKPLTAWDNYKFEEEEKGEVLGKPKQFPQNNSTLPQKISQRNIGKPAFHLAPAEEKKLPARKRSIILIIFISCFTIILEEGGTNLVFLGEQMAA